jgi:myo-inositol-1(or 4)-monophosphatase
MTQPTPPASPFDRATVARILDAMTAAARSAEDVIVAGSARRDTLVWQTKGDSDYLTEIDTTSEDVIRAELTNALHGVFPTLRVLGEESWRDEPLPAGLAFVVDPLDGTTNFLHGLPVFSVSIAAIHDGEPLIAVVLDIPHNELFTAVRGFGARLNGAAIHVSEISEPARALIGTGFPFGGNAEIARYARQFMPVAQATAGIRRAGSAAIDLAWLAAGRFEAFWELHLSPWDIAAGILLVREAGGIVSGIDGRPAHIGTSPLVAGNPSMHAWLLGVLDAADGERAE